MKKLFVLAALILLAAGTASADQINFIWDPGTGETLQGVGSPAPTGWSNNDGVVSLGASQWNLLGGNATVYGFYGSDAATLTHRGFRGLGIGLGEYDEVDSYNLSRPERIEVAFNQPYYLNSFEVRSLFVEFTPDNPNTEVGAVDFLLNNQSVFTQAMSGQQNIWQGTKGILSTSYYSAPYLIDKLVFYVPSGYDYSSGSEFAVAKLNVTAIPEPISTVLFLTGGTILVVRRLRRK